MSNNKPGDMKHLNGVMAIFLVNIIKFFKDGDDDDDDGKWNNYEKRNMTTNDQNVIWSEYDLSIRMKRSFYTQICGHLQIHKHSL